MQDIDLDWNSLNHEGAEKLSAYRVGCLWAEADSNCERPSSGLSHSPRAKIGATSACAKSGVRCSLASHLSNLGACGVDVAICGGRQLVGGNIMGSLQRLAAAFTVLLIAACASSTLERTGAVSRPPLPPNAEVAIYTADRQAGHPFDVLATISYADPGKFQILSAQDAYGPLKQKAREVGATSASTNATSLVPSRSNLGPDVRPKMRNGSNWGNWSQAIPIQALRPNGRREGVETRRAASKAWTRWGKDIVQTTNEPIARTHQGKAAKAEVGTKIRRAPVQVRPPAPMTSRA